MIWQLVGTEWIGEDGQRLRAIGGGGGGKTTSTTTVQMPGPTATELKIQEKQLALMDIQLAQVQRENEALAEVFPDQKEFLKTQMQLIKDLQPLIAEQLKPPSDIEKQIKDLSDQRALAVLKGEAPALSPQQEENINQLFASAQTEGEKNIRRFTEELAASRGMNVTDSPIGAEVLPEVSRFQSALQGSKAQAKLDVASSQQIFTEGLRQFQEGLRQRAIENRLAISGAAPPMQTGSATQAIGSLTPILDVLGQQRIAQRSFKTTERFSPGVFDYMKAIGQVAATVGAAAAGASSKRFKRDIEPLDRAEAVPDGYTLALDRVTRTPIVRYRYTWEDDRSRPPHIGPILEHAPPEISDDGLTVNLLDYAGLLHAALKAVDRKVLALERRKH